MSRSNLGWLLGITAVALLGLSISHSAPSRDTKIGKKHELVRLMVDVLDEVQSKYVKELDDTKMRELVENMIDRGLSQYLDPHSAYINAEEYKQSQKTIEGAFGGVGIKISWDPQRGIFVESPMVGTPAYRAGVQPEDIITKIDGKVTDTMKLHDAVSLIQGEPGSKVTLTVLHKGGEKAVDLEMTRAKIEIHSILGDVRSEDNEWDYMIDPDSKIAYVRLTAFSKTTIEELTHVVEKLQKDGLKGLVLDLRNNPGGLLRSAVEVSNLFLPDGKRIVSTKGRNRKEEVYDSKKSGTLPGATSYPICILLNRYSASASEIVAAALQDHLRAIIVGERSYGKGSVQNIIELEGRNSALKLTTASYWRPSGKNIHRFPDSKDEDEWGVHPNKGFEVKLTDKERVEYFKYRRERDVVWQPGKAKVKEKEPQADKKEPQADKKEPQADKKEPFKDRVLEKALEYLRGKVQKADAGPIRFDRAGRNWQPLPGWQLPAASSWAWSQRAADLVDIDRSRFRGVWA
jgi:carboxyl-terminal processing protease